MGWVGYLPAARKEPSPLRHFYKESDMKALLSLLVVLSVVVANSAEVRRPISKPQIPSGHQDGISRPTTPIGHPTPKMVENDKPDVPSAWGVIEVSSDEGWYGVELISKSCIDYGYTITKVLAKGCKGLEANRVVFLRHDHETGRWHILFAGKQNMVKVGPSRPLRIGDDVEDLFKPQPKEVEEIPPPPADAT